MVAVFFPHRTSFILIDVPIPAGVHLVKHLFGVAGVLVSAYPAIIIGVRHGHSAAAFSILLVTTVGVFLVTISARLAVSTFVVIVAIRYHEAFLKGLCSERIVGRRSNGSSTERCSESRSERERND